MNKTVEQLKKELCYDNDNLQEKLLLPERKRRKLSRSPSPLPSARLSELSVAVNKMNYELFRARLSIGENTRDELFGRLKECNERLEKLLSYSDRISQIQDTAPGYKKRASPMGSTFEEASKSSAKLFKAVQDAWQCSCQPYRFAYLSLEHRTLADVCFEIILKYIAATNSHYQLWHWRMVRCGNMKNCSVAQEAGSNTTSLLPSNPSRTEVILRLFHLRHQISESGTVFSCVDSRVTITTANAWGLSTMTKKVSTSIQSRERGNTSAATLLRKGSFLKMHQPSNG
jgi:hypothetical protein